MTRGTSGGRRRVSRGVRHAAAALGLGAAVCGTCLWGLPADSAEPRLVDRFDDVAAWQAVGSDGVRASIHSAEGVGGRALRLDFDFGRAAGYALARRAVPVDLPAHYEISFYVRADAPVNDFQFKLIDASGDNVWWFQRRNFPFPHEWQLVTIKMRHVQFAWGPTQDRVLRHAAALEFVVSAGRGGGGRGSVYFSELRIREVLPPPAVFPPPVAEASSQLAGADPALAVDDNPATAWRSEPATGRAQQVIIDFGQPREFGGLILHWDRQTFASRYDVQFSSDGAQWRTVRRVLEGRGGPDALLLTEAETRFVRLLLHDGPAGAYGLAEVEIKALEFGASPNAFFEALARLAPRGIFPRGLSGEQPYWTLVGVDGGSESGLLSEDGALEVATGGFSIEPFVARDGHVVTWAGVDTSQVLLDQYLPIPGVTWRQPEWELRISAFAAGSAARSRLVASYELRNRTARPLTLTLALAVRPFQVNPLTQGLSTVGGVSPIRDITWDRAALSVNGTRRIFPLQSPQLVGAYPFDAGPVPSLLAEPGWAGRLGVQDDVGYASGILGYPVTLAPRASFTAGLVVPLSGAATPPQLGGLSPRDWLVRERDVVARMWRTKLNRVSIVVPAAAHPLVDTMRSSLAHILMTRDGAALRPGTRSYARSWIRDGAMMASSLMRLGHADVAADFLRWYAPHQFDSGKVPCCVDDRGADPVPEHDSGGELISLTAELYRHTRDQALLSEMWSHVDRAAGYLDALRRSERVDANLAPHRRPFYGLLPASISHEGYSEKPMHSYWDDFWALKGYADAETIAMALDRGEASRRLSAQRVEFHDDLQASLRATVAAHRISHVPASAELGDFDPTSTTVAIAQHGAGPLLPPDLVRATYERYWAEFVDRRSGQRKWDAYTPYELRTVGTFVRLGWRDRAHALLAFFLASRRPAAWNQWAEVVARDPRSPRFLGDMPHGWVASDFIGAVLDLFAYEREPDRAMVIGAGVPLEWLDGPGVAVNNLRTPYGPLSYSIKRAGPRVILRLSARELPPGGFILRWPGKDSPGAARINGRATIWRDMELPIHDVRATVVLDRVQ
jgi:hypothetical protein